MPGQLKWANERFANVEGEHDGLALAMSNSQARSRGMVHWELRRTSLARQTKRESDMQRKLLGIPMALSLVLCVATPSAFARTEEACSNATLSGDYGMTIHGQNIGILVPGGSGAGPTLQPFPVPLPVDGVAMTHFDGKGHLTQVDFIMRNGTSLTTPSTPQTANGFRADETGSYSVSSDCTGTAVINFPNESNIELKFVLVGHGREIRTVVSGQHIPLIPNNLNCAPPAGCDLAAQIRSDGVRVDGAARDSK